MDDIVSGERRGIQDGGQDLACGLSAIQRLDLWLDETNRAVIGAKIAPRFERMRFGEVPLARGRGLVFIETEVRAERHARQGAGKIKVRGRIVDTVST